MKATEIDRQYVVPLRLKNMPAAAAIEVLLGEGFRCRLVPVSPIGLDEPPLSNCTKEPSGFGPLCDELDLTLRFERMNEVPTLEELFRRLDSFKVQSALSFCPYKPQVSAEYLAMRETAEAALRQTVEGLAPLGHARAAYDALMLAGFACGFAVEQGAAVGTANLVCTKRPSGTKFCFESKLVMDTDWPPEAKEFKGLFGQLQLARVMAVRSSCYVPSVRGGGRPL